jgi:predicted PurR-regulated permease PerM
LAHNVTTLQEHREKLERSANQARLALQGLLFLFVIAALYFARDFLLPVVLAFFIALTLRPAVRFLQKWLVPPWLAATVFVIILIIVGTMVGYLLSGPVSDWIDQAPLLQQKFASKFAGLSQVWMKFSDLTDQIQNASTPAQGSAVQEVVVRQHLFPGLLVSMTSYPIQFAVTLAATLVIAVFLLASGDLFYEKLVRILPNLSARKKALHIVYDIESEVSTYVLTLSVINACLGMIIAVSFRFLGMPSFYLWGMLIFVFNFVPYVGTLAGICLAGFMAIVSFDSLSYAMLPPLTYAGWALLESEIIRPQILGSRFEMNAVAILLFLAFWSWLWGIPGAAIAVPALVTLKVFCNHVEGMAGLGEFLSRRFTERPEGVTAAEP